MTKGDEGLFVDILEFYFVHSLLHQEVERCLNQNASYLGLSILELQVLWIAASSDVATIAEMARITTYTKERIEEVVASLEQDDLVRLVCARDSLCMFVQASDKGDQVIHQMYDRPNRCKCLLCTEDPSIKELIEDTRKLVVKLRGRGSCDRIEDLARRRNSRFFVPTSCLCNGCEVNCQI